MIFKLFAVLAILNLSGCKSAAKNNKAALATDEAVAEKKLDWIEEPRIDCQNTQTRPQNNWFIANIETIGAQIKTMEDYYNACGQVEVSSDTAHVDIDHDGGYNGINPREDLSGCSNVGRYGYASIGIVGLGVTMKKVVTAATPTTQIEHWNSARFKIPCPLGSKARCESLRSDYNRKYKSDPQSAEGQELQFTLKNFSPSRKDHIDYLTKVVKTVCQIDDSSFDIRNLMAPSQK